jgi:tetratricopeptide (TPR) repeat protein
MLKISDYIKYVLIFIAINCLIFFINDLVILILNGTFYLDIYQSSLILVISSCITLIGLVIGVLVPLLLYNPKHKSILLGAQISLSVILLSVILLKIDYKKNNDYKKSQSANNYTTAITREPNPQTAKQLYNDGWEFINRSRSIATKNREKALALNTVAIEKFTAAYKADTSFSDAVLEASECTLFAKDYQSSLFWLNKLLVLDTSIARTADVYLLIGFCYVNIGELQRSEHYFEKTMELWKVINLTMAKELIKDNLLAFSDSIFEQTDVEQQSILKAKGVSACDYSAAILAYVQSIDTAAHYDELISSRKRQCR